MTRHRRLTLKVEQLESRDVPATYGVPWADPTHLTASFAPDGTSLQTESSDLMQILNQPGLAGTGKQEILRALQSWVSVANLNIGLVADGGQAFGTAGAIQGDSRFGDIRFGTITSKDAILALSQPHDVTAGTYAGDILFNDAVHFSKGESAGTYDLYTAAVHEVGHALGLDHSPDPDSVMFDHYRGVRSGLGSGDVQEIQKLYGVRQEDRFDKQGSNGTFATASTISILDSLTRTVMASTQRGDLTTASDLDHYKFTAALPGWVTIHLNTSGISLLTAQLDIYNASQQRLGGTLATDPLTGDLTYRLFVEAGKTYTVRVGATQGSFFNIGAYELQIVPDGVQVAVSGPSDPPELIPGTNDSFLTATNLSLTQQLLGSDARYDFAYREAISTSSDVDFYRFSVPRDLGTSQVLNVTVWNLDSTNFIPKATLYDGMGRVVASEIVLNEAGTYSIQAMQPWQAGQTYFVKVESARDAAGQTQTGRYFLGIDFNNNQANLQTVQANTPLTQSAPRLLARIDVRESQLIHLVLAVESTTKNSGVQLSIYDSLGHLVWTLTAFAGETKTNTIWLKGDSYRYVYKGIARDGSVFQNATFTLKMKGLSDPIDPYASDPDAPPSNGGQVTPPPSRQQQTTRSWYYSPSDSSNDSYYY